MSISDARQLLEGGRIDQAEQAYKQMARRPELKAQAFYGLGLICLRRKDVVAARDWFTRSVQANPDEENSRFYLATIAANSGNVDEAIRLFAQVLIVNPRHAGALARLTKISFGPGPVSSTVTPGGPARVAGVRASSRPTSLRPPRPPSSAAAVVGIAKHVKMQPVPFNGQPAAKQSLTFRVEVIDQHGMHIRTVGVEMRNFTIRGSVDEGDWVEIKDVRDGGRVKEVHNLTTGTRVLSKLW